MVKPIDPELRADILKAVRDEGMSCYKASKVFGVNDGTIKNWLDQETKGSSRNYILEINALKKKLDNAYRVIGKLTAEVNHPKE